MHLVQHPHSITWISKSLSGPAAPFVICMYTCTFCSILLSALSNSVAINYSWLTRGIHSTHLCINARRLDLDAFFGGVPNGGWERMDLDTGRHEWHLMEEVCHQCSHPNARARTTTHADADLKWRAS
jgi:hypothetical protein